MSNPEYHPDHDVMNVSKDSLELLTVDNFCTQKLNFNISNEEADFQTILSKQGLQLEGWYDAQTPSTYDPIGKGRLPVVSFTYYKNGELEPTQRLLVWDGDGYGVFGDHAGQESAFYLRGLQIGDVENGDKYYTLPDKGGRRNFSMDCIWNGDRDQRPIDAATGHVKP